MRTLILLLTTLLLLSCSETPKKKTTQTQKVEKEIVIPDSLLGKDWEGNEILLGKVSYAQMTHYTNEWFNAEYDRYKVNASLITKISPLLDDKTVVLLMGTWCEDSQREVPGMMKILDQSGYAVEDMEIIAVDEDKRTPDGLEKNHALAYVPALIFYENGKEINRIVEFPIGTLEEDIHAILKGQDYKNAYAEWVPSF